MASSKTKTVATRQGTQVGSADAALLREMGADATTRTDNLNRDMLAVPFLTILQDLSPQVKPKKSEYVKGAQPGDIFNSVTQVLEKKVRVIPCAASQVFIEWVPREKSGGGKNGFVAAHQPGASVIATATREGARTLLPNGNLLQDTRQHYVLVLHDDGSTEGALIAMKSTQIKTSKRWLTITQSPLLNSDGSIAIARPLMYMREYTLGSTEQSNDQGSWYGWTIADPERVLNVEQYRLAKAFAEQMAQGAVKVDYSQMADGHGDGTDTPRDLGGDDVAM